MIRVKVLRGLDLQDDASSELFVTISLGGLSKTSRVTKKFTPPPPPVADDDANDVPAAGRLKRSMSSSSALMAKEAWIWDEELELALSSSTPTPAPSSSPTPMPDDATTKKEEEEEAVVVECCSSGQAITSLGTVRLPVSRLGYSHPVQQWYSLEGSAKGALLLSLLLVDVAPSLLLTPPHTPTLSAAAATTTPPPATAPAATAPPLSTTKLDTSLMPMGLADYFVIAGCAPHTSRQERLAMLARRRRQLQPNHHHQHDSSVVVVVDELSQATVSGTDCVTLSPLLLERFPAQDRPEIEFPTKCEMFLLPDGVEILVNPAVVPPERNFTFILVNNNVKLFGFCLEVWEPLPAATGELELDLDVLYAPVVYCYLTRLPLSHLDFKWILHQTVQARSTGFFPRVVQRVLLEVPTPLPGLFSVEFDLVQGGSRRIALPDFGSSLPPLLYPDLCSHLLGWFSIDDVVRLWIAALTEQKILLHSSNRETLGMLSESLVQLMYPFKWENGFIPVLPTSLMQIFDAPIPVILGLHTNALQLIPPSAQIDDTFIQVDADRCDISFPPTSNDYGGGGASLLPTELRTRLFRMIRQAQQLKDTDRRDKVIRLAFVECLASLLQGYRECFFSLASGADGGATVFNKAQFFLHQQAQRAQLASTLGQLFSPAGAAAPVSTDGNGDNNNTFLNHFFETTAFERFKVSQHDPENEVFHQVYRARRARERERDQRLGSLAGLQTDASSSQLPPPPVRVWSARLARWDCKSQDPIEPVAATADSEVVHLVCAPLLQAGERVRCGAFGEAHVVEAKDEMCHVQLAFGGQGYFHASSLSATTAAATTTPTDARAPFAALVAQSCDKAAFKKALAHYKRMVGATATTELAAVQRKQTITKTPQESKVERVLIRTITNIFQDKPVSQVDLTDCRQHLSELFARNTLMQVLKSQHSDSTWLATPGRGRRLGDDSFASLCELVDALLASCAMKEDYSNARVVLDVSPFFYCGEETLQMKLKGHALWKRIMFWEYAFAESLVLIGTQQQQRQSGFSPSQRQQQQPQPQQQASQPQPQPQPDTPTSRSLAQVQDAAQRLGGGALPLFEQLSVFVHNMLNLDVAEDMARAFVDRVGSVFRLEPDHKTTLNMLITNICKSMSSYQEEDGNGNGQDAEDGEDDEAPTEDHSPTNGGGRNSVHSAASSSANSTRKRSGIDTMFSRLSVSWRKATTPATAAATSTPAAAAPTPAPTKRRDSVSSWLG